MAFNFWEAQRRARSKTTLYVVIFLALTALVAWGIEVFVQAFSVPCEPGDPYCSTDESHIPLYGPLFALITIGMATFQYLTYASQGGSSVAESMGCKLVNPGTTNFKEQQLLNIVQEMAIASGKPVPKVYLIPANEINAFAAGLTPDKAAVAVSVGALNQLSREELQGVVAHEFGHIYNGDMKISLRLAAMVMAYSFILYLGLRVLQYSSYRRGNDRNGNGQLIVAVAFTIGGALMWFFGSVLKACVSREREYLADACAVQFTRSPDGIAGALRKIAKPQTRDMPATGSSYSHMYIEDTTAFSSIFATHPPIEDRIAAIEGMTYLPDEWKKDLKQN
jgi:heat shock protein HtpX